MSLASTLSWTTALALACAATAARAAPVETVLYSFSGTGTYADGANPLAGLVAGADGSLYGTTSEGGASLCSCGTVFKLSPPAAGQTKWTQAVLHSFQGYPSDGAAPVASLIFDHAGNLYGTTLLGGVAGFGTVFMVQGAASGGTTETVLHVFGSAAGDGQFPYANLALRAGGALYGTTALGGAAGQGMVFKLQVAGTGSGLSVLHSFGGGQDGAQPYVGVVFDRQGNLYGATSSDGFSFAGGTAFQLTAGGTETVLHTFTDITIGGPTTFDGGIPDGNLGLDTAGNVYGTTLIGGDGPDAGTVFKLARPAAGATAWTETLLHSFRGVSDIPPATVDGSSPAGGVLIDGGSLYGTTTGGGAAENDDGILYRLAPPAGGATVWTAKTLFSFNGFPNGGAPFGNLIADAQGNFYGTTSEGTTRPKTFEVGTVFRLTP